MYKKLISSLLIMGTVFSSSPVFSSSYEPLKYPLFGSCSRYRCFFHGSPLSDNGFSDFDTSYLDYFYHLARSNKITSKGYPYRACNYRIELTARIDIYSPRDRNRDENLGAIDSVKIHYKSDGILSSGFSPINYRLLLGTLFDYGPYVPSFSSSDPPSVILNDMKRLLNQMVSMRTDDRYTVENFSVSGTVLSPSRYYYDYGCDTVPIDVQPQTCPNLVIRGLPFIRNTITCYQKNR
ncbi:MAG: hypothetical protein QNJ08_11920 [Crocosphaera sp.]|nr:hypothetical protein [Crocosphaera sp.]